MIMRIFQKKIFLFLIVPLVILMVIASILISISLKENNKTKELNKSFQNVYTLLLQNNFEQAKSILNEKIEKYPQNSQLKLGLANIYLKEANEFPIIWDENILEAQGIIKEALEENKDNIDAYYLLGNSYEMNGDFDQSLEYYQKALKIQPNSPKLLFQIGHLYWYLKGNPDEIMYYYREAESNINDTTIDDIKGRIYAGIAVIEDVFVHDYDKAEEYFKKAASVIPDISLKAEFYSDLSCLELDRRYNIEKALKYAEQSLAVDENNEFAHVIYAKVMVAKISQEATSTPSEIEKLKQYLFGAMLINPYRSLTRYISGQLFFIVGDRKSALEEYDQALEIADKDYSLGEREKMIRKGDIYFSKALVYLIEDNLIEASKNMKESFFYNPVKTVFMINEMNLNLEELLP